MSSTVHFPGEQGVVFVVADEVIVMERDDIDGPVPEIKFYFEVFFDEVIPAIDRAQSLDTRSYEGANVRVECTTERVTFTEGELSILFNRRRWRDRWN